MIPASKWVRRSRRRAAPWRSTIRPDALPHRGPPNDRVRRLGDRVVAEAFAVEGACHLQHWCRLLAYLRRRHLALLQSDLIGKAGIPPVELGLRVAIAGAAKMGDH